MIDRKYLFDQIKAPLFGGKFNQLQVDGINLILNEWESRFEGKGDFRQLAYIYGSVYHETAHTMQPIEEYGKGKGHAYGKPINGKCYYGRGYIQLTWHYNYKKLGDILGVDLLEHPELALQPEIAVKILFEGMLLGLFTGKRLGQFFNDEAEDWYNARRIVNGTDKAQLIANQAKIFYHALRIV